jgi:ketosteroid isomerase-like protein
MDTDQQRSQVRTELLEALYAAYNERDFSRVVDHLAPDVRWFDQLSGVEMTSRPQVEAYWKEQAALIRIETYPVSMTALPDGGVVVVAAQTVRNLEGQLWSSQTVTHTYSFTDDNLIAAMKPG